MQLHIGLLHVVLMLPNMKSNLASSLQLCLFLCTAVKGVPVGMNVVRTERDL